MSLLWADPKSMWASPSAMFMSLGGLNLCSKHQWIVAHMEDRCPDLSFSSFLAMVR